MTGFVGSSGGGTKPIPVTPEQMEPILKRMGMVDAGMYDRYAIGDHVKVIHGPLEGTKGKLSPLIKRQAWSKWKPSSLVGQRLWKWISPKSKKFSLAYFKVNKSLASGQLFNASLFL